MNEKFIVSFSGGKDSTLSLYRAIKQGMSPAGLLVNIDRKNERSWFHGIPRTLLEQVSRSMQIPLLLVGSDGQNYAEKFEQALDAAASMGVEYCVFGDIDIEDHRTWGCERCAKSGIKPLFPLWNEDREKIAHEFINAGFKAVIKIVDTERLPASFVGRTLDFDTLSELKAHNVDVCGENGEYHTFVYDGPLFAFPIRFETHGTVILGRHAALDIRPQQ